MHLNMTKEVTALRKMTVQQLKAKYAEVFGDETRTGNKAWLVKRIAWRLQANAEGGLSERARKRALELANDSDVRTTAPNHRLPELNSVSVSTIVTNAIRTDPRLPTPGTILVSSRDHRSGSATHRAAARFPPSLARNHPRDRHPYQRIPVLQTAERRPFMSRQTPRAACQQGRGGIRHLSLDFDFWRRTLDILTVLQLAVLCWKGETSMSKRTSPTTSKKASPLMVRLDAESKQALTDAAELRRISISDYVRTVTVAQARREVASAREQTVLLSPDEQLAFWRALQAPPKLTPAQKRLSAIMRGAK